MLSDRLTFNSKAAGADIGPNLFVWGEGAHGRLGLGDAVSRSSPVQLSGTWSQASFGGFTSSFVKVGGTLWTSGYNGTGYLGLSDLVTRSSPTQVAGTWLSCNTGYRAMFATRPDGSLWSWGFASYGLLGVADTIRRSSPTQIAGTWRFAFTGNYNAVGIKADGSLWSWGNNSFGGLGIQTSSGNQSSPVQISGTWVKAVTASATSSDISGAALRADGSLWTWGTDGNGQLGLGDTTAGARSSPTQIVGTWKDVVTGGRSQPAFLALRHDGTIWTWGRTNYGGLGFSSPAGNQSSPVQVGTGTWVSIVASTSSRMVFRTDGQMWVWGKNDSGQIGLGDTVNRSSPVQVSGTWFNSGNGFVGGLGRAFKF